MNVITLRRKPWPVSFVYVGRAFAGLDAHPLANPFKIAAEAEREGAVERYRQWMNALPNLDALLAQVRDDSEYGRAPLACWCCDWKTGEQVITPCHAIVIAEAITQRWPEEAMTW